MFRNTSRRHTNTSKCTLRALGRAEPLFSVWGSLFSLFHCVECFGLMCFLECQNPLSCKFKYWWTSDAFPEGYKNRNVQSHWNGNYSGYQIPSIQVKQPSLRPSALPYVLLYFFSILYSSLPRDLFSFIFSPPPSTLVIYRLLFLPFAAQAFIPNHLLTIAFFSPAPFSPVPHLHDSFANTNDHMRQMTLITVHLEWKTTERYFPTHSDCIAI